MTHALSPRAFRKIVELVDACRWGTCLNALSVLWRYVIEDDHHPDTFVGLSSRELAAELSIGPSTAAKALARLVEQGVLDCDGLADGSRPNGYRFRDLPEWEGVPWRAKRTSAEVALLVERWLRPVEVENPAFARARGRAQRPVVPTRVRALARPREHAQPGQIEALARAHDRAQIGGRDAPDTFLTTSKNPPPTAGTSPRGGTPTPKEGVLFSLIWRVTGQYLVDEGWKDQVRGIAAAEDLDVQRLVDEVEPTLRASNAGPSRCVVVLAQAAAVQLSGGAIDNSAKEQARLESDLKVHRRRLGVYEAEGDDEMAKIAREQVRECENRLRTLRAEEGAA